MEEHLKVRSGDEVESLPTEEELAKGSTGFHRVDGEPIIYDYALKGFFKESCSMLRRVKGTASSKLAAHKKVVDGLIFVTPRQIPLILPDGASLGVNERPLRAQTPKGDRVAIARSETAPAGTTMEFTVELLDEGHAGLLQEWLAYGAKHGLGQWRNAGFGRFEYEAEGLE